MVSNPLMETENPMSADHILADRPTNEEQDNDN